MNEQIFTLIGSAAQMLEAYNIKSSNVTDVKPISILTSPVRDKNETRLVGSVKIEEHDILPKILECRMAWQKVKDLKTVPGGDDADAEEGLPGDLDKIRSETSLGPVAMQSKQSIKDKKAQKSKSQSHVSSLRPFAMV